MMLAVEAAQRHHRSVSDVSVSDESTFDSCGSDCYSLEAVDLESGVLELKKKVHSSKVERICRICHLGFEGCGLDSSGLPIDLGCSCKGDLGAAHKHCAETWFKIKGDT